MTEVNHHFAISPIFNVHDCIFQTLDRVIDYDEFGAPILYPADVYEAGIQTANGAQIIFAMDHPDPYLYEDDPEKAIREVGGRVAGTILNPYVNRTGHPTARGQLNLLQDPDIEALIADGKLSMSPSVWSTYDDTGRIVKIRFQNLLIFPEVPGGANVPRDPGTIILNTKPIQKPGKTMAETIEKPVIDPALSAQITELAQQFKAFKTDAEKAKEETESMKAETEYLKAQLFKKDEELTKEKEALKKEKEAFAQFTAKLEEEKAAAREREFKGLLNDPIFPEGLLKAENAEETLKAEFDASPVQFTRHVLSIAMTQNQALEGKGEQGQQFAAPKSDSKWDTNEGKTLLEKFASYGVKRDQLGV